MHNYPEPQLLNIEEKVSDIEDSTERINELFDKLVKSYSDIYEKCLVLVTTTENNVLNKKVSK